MVSCHTTALLALLCVLLNYVVLVVGGPVRGKFSQFFHTAAGLSVTAVTLFFVCGFLALFGKQSVQLGHLIVLLPVPFPERVRVVDSPRCGWWSRLLCVAV